MELELELVELRELLWELTELRLDDEERELLVLLNELRLDRLLPLTLDGLELGELDELLRLLWED